MSYFIPKNTSGLPGMRVNPPKLRMQIRRDTRAILLLLAILLPFLSGCQMAASSANMDGVRLFQSGNYQAASQRFRQAIATDPRNSDAYYNEAATLHRLGVQSSNSQLMKQAEEMYNVCLDLNENHADARRGLAVLLGQSNRSDKAFALMKNWVVTQPQVADARVELARLYQEYGDDKTAEQQLTEALKVDLNNSRAWKALASIQEKTGHFAQAVANYQRSLQINRFQPEVTQKLASLSPTLNANPASTPTWASSPNFSATQPVNLSGANMAPAGSIAPPPTIPTIRKERY
jgi:Tfp pilus assembly protein PilF